jgi:cyanophycin synthetase
VDELATPRPAFDESRGRAGANRYHAGPSVLLLPLGPAAADGAAHGRWIAHVLTLCGRLGWPDPAPRVHAHVGGPTLVFAAPEDTLFTATEVNEWAWERAAWEHPAMAAAGFAAMHPAEADPQAHFSARCDAERSRPLARLLAAAQARGLPWVLDDDTLTLGEGAGGQSHARAALPLAMDVPWPRLHGVAKVLVTGSNGKTTTTRLLAAMAAAAGQVPGLCSTEGVWVGGQLVEPGDYAGPAGARAVLRHPAVTAALLETARGGILRRGLAVRRADVAVVTNISADHLGEYGVDSVFDIAQAKLVLAHAVGSAEDPGSGTLVLNGEDDTLLRCALQLPHASHARWALFARRHDSPLLVALRARGRSTCGVQDGRLLLSLHGDEHDLGATADMPLSLDNAAGFNIENLAAAALAAGLLGWPTRAVREALHRFGSDPADNPGRLQRLPYRGATVLLDYAHNPDGLAQLLHVARALRPGRVGLLLGQAGNRSNEAIAELARAAAGFAPDLVVIKELPQMLRGRPAGEVPALIETALHEVGVRGTRFRHEPDEGAAAAVLLAWARPGDVLVLPVHTAAVREALAAQLLAG